MALMWTTHLRGGPKKVNHAAALVGRYIYSFGGYCSQQNMNEGFIDVYVLCTVTLRWKALDNPTDPKELACVPFQRFGHTAVAHGTKIYIWGGKNQSLACNRLFCFDTKSLKWSCPKVKGTVPCARDGHTACLVDDKMYVIGGYADEFKQYADGLYVLDLITMTWSFLEATGEQPTYRDFHSAVAVNGKMYIFGGRGGINEPFYTRLETYDNNMYVFDPNTKSWDKKTSSHAPIGRRSLGMVTVGKRIYIFGGYNGMNGNYYNDLHYYDTEIDEWSGEIKTYGLIPCERRRHCTIIANNHIFVFGGTSSTTRYYSGLDDLYVDTDYFTDKYLTDFDDLHVLDLRPTLCTLSMLAVIRNNLCTSWLPKTLQQEIEWKITDNNLKKYSDGTNV